MRNTIKVAQRFTCGLIVLTLVLAIAGLAQAQRTKRKLRPSAEEAQKASDVFTQIMNVPDKSIPRDLLAKAEAIAVFPGVVKGRIHHWRARWARTHQPSRERGLEPAGFLQSWRRQRRPAHRRLKDRFCLTLYEYRSAREFDEQQI